MVALFAAGVATFALLYSAQAVLPALGAEFGVAPGGSTLAVSLATVGLGAALLVAGPLSEAYGRTRLIRASMTLSGLVALACAVAPDWRTLLALRLVEGVTLAGVPAVATAYLREEMPGGFHARAAGLYIGGTALGGMAGRLVTAGVADVAGWRWGLAAAGAVGIGCALAVQLTLPASRNFTAAPARPRHLAALVRRAATDPALLALYGIGCSAMGAFIAVLNTLAYRLTAAPFGLSLAAAGLVFLVYPAGSVSSAVAGRFVDRVGRRSVVAVGCGITALGVVVTLADRLVVIVTGVAVMTVGFFAVHGVASGWVTERAHAAGVATGPAAASYLVAYYAGSSLFGGVAGGAWSLAGWPAVVGLSVTLVLAALLLSRCGGAPPADGAPPPSTSGGQQSPMVTQAPQLTPVQWQL
jgi:YNFM family putative membrane transporter